MNAMTRTRRHRAFAQFVVLLLLVAAIAGYAPRALAAPLAPVALEFMGGAGGIADSGFTTVLLNTRPADLSKLTLDPTSSGKLTIQSTAGDLPPNGTAQDNALAVVYDSQGSYTIGARLLAPLLFNSTYQSAGIFVGKDQNNYIRFSAGVGSRRSNAQRLQLDVMDHGKLRSSTIALPAGTFGGIHQSLDLFLNIEHNGGKLTALYRIDSDDPNGGSLATTRNFPRWLRGSNNTVYGGVVTTSRGALSAVAFSFDWFRLTLAPQITPSIVGTKTVDKDGLSSKVNPGDTLTYTISVKNNGPATSIQVSDPLPVDTVYVPGSATGGAIYDSANNRVTFQLGTLGTGQTATFSFQAKINPAPLQSSTIQNMATLTYGSSAFPALLSASTLVAGTPDLSGSIYAASPAQVGPNGLVTYTLTLQNDGPGVASNATAQLTVPAGTTYVQNSASASSGNLTIDGSLTTLNWAAAGPLAADSTVTISFTTRVTGPFLNNEPIVSQAIVQADAALPSIEAAQALFVDTTSVGPVSGSKEVDKAEVNLGDTLTYTITVANTDAAAATNLDVVDPLPQDVTYVGGSLTTPAIGTAAYDSATRRVSWQIPTLGATQVVTLSLKATVNQLLHSSVILNKAVLTNPNVAVPQTLLAASTVVRNVADLSDSTYTASPASIGANGTVTYTLNLLNSGTAAASGATAHLTIPSVAGAALVPGSAKASSGSISQAGGQLDWTANGPMPVGTLVKISFQAKLTSTPANGTIIPSSASLQATGTLPTILTARTSYNELVQAPEHRLLLPIIIR
jgi:uncharacterized repeat protein (TIGR01451 family)